MLSVQAVEMIEQRPAVCGEFGCQFLQVQRGDGGVLVSSVVAGQITE